MSTRKSSTRQAVTLGLSVEQSSTKAQRHERKTPRGGTSCDLEQADSIVTSHHFSRSPSNRTRSASDGRALIERSSPRDMLAAMFLLTRCQEQCGSPSTSHRSLRIARLMAFMHTIAFPFQVLGTVLFRAFVRLAVCFCSEIVI